MLKISETFRVTFIRSSRRLFSSNTKVNHGDPHPLTDTFGRNHNYLRISLTERCNLRCQYCMPSEGVNLSKKDKLLTTDEVIKISNMFVKQGVNKIRLTGGEPTVRKDLEDIIYNLKRIEGLEVLAMTTNGLVLTKQLVALQRAGLDILNISLDTLKYKKYEQITRRKGWERVMMGIDLALQLGYNPVKINCVIMKGFNDDEIIDFVELTREKSLDVRFIEYMPFTGNKWDLEKFVSYKDMLKEITHIHSDFSPLPNGPNDTSKAWKVPGYAGQVGFITSMSEHFCGSCNRLRLTADGSLKVCLFGLNEISLRDAMRSNCSDEDLLALISEAVKRKKRQHADKRKQAPPNSILIDNLYRKHFLHLNNGNYFYATRYYSTNSPESELTHVDKKGKIKMVDVHNKDTTLRTAGASAVIKVGPIIGKLIHENSIKKGNVLTVAEVAGILGAKKTSELIPLCHNIPLTDIKVTVFLNDKHEVIVQARIQCSGKTGVEMEALTAVSVAALTVYDMCKAVSKDIIISDIRLVSKSGGKSGDYVREEIILKDFDREPTWGRFSPFVGPV